MGRTSEEEADELMVDHTHGEEADHRAGGGHFKSCFVSFGGFGRIANLGSSLPI